MHMSAQVWASTVAHMGGERSLIIDDDWYSVSALDESTYLISEPKYVQKNNEYLLIGAERAVLFDSGPGKRNIEPLVRSLTPPGIPVTVIASHSHYDHIGNHHRFDHIAAADLPVVKRQIYSGRFQPRLGLRYAPRPRRFPISEWWAIGETIDLGGRTVELIHLPGHTADSIGLLDRSHGYIFTGDFLCGNRDRVRLGALFPTSSVADYLDGALGLMRAYEGESLFGGHDDPFPAMDGSTILDLITTARRLTDSPHRLPLVRETSGNVTLWAGHQALRAAGLRK